MASQLLWEAFYVSLLLRLSSSSSCSIKEQLATYDWQMLYVPLQ